MSHRRNVNVASYEDRAIGRAEASSKIEAASVAAAGVALAPLQTVIRPMALGDVSFIIDSWCGSYSKCPEAASTDADVFKIEQRNLIYRLLPKCKVLVACDPAQPNSIRGWACAEPARESGGLWILHYALVRPELQGMGIATSLVAPFREESPEGTLWTTHHTFASKWFGKDWTLRNRHLLYTLESTKRNEIKGYY